MSIERPRVAQLDALLATVAKIHDTEAKLSALKEQVAREARALAEIPDKRLRIEAGFYAYWMAPEASASDIALGATGRRHPAELMKLAGAVSIGIACGRCQEDLPIRSRTEMKEVLDQARGASAFPETYQFLCIACQNALDEERLSERMAECDAADARDRELAAMRYAEYLQTEEFEAARDTYLWWLADQHNAIVCETCDAGTGFGTYHKAKESGGRGDLVVLCAACRDALLAAGKLGEAPLEANLIPAGLSQSILEGLQFELST